MADSKKYDGSQWEHSLRKLTTATEAVEKPLYSDGSAITSYTISGNTVQNGTPTPSNPVDVNGVGVRTDNLIDYKIPISNGQQTTNIYLGSTQTVRQIKKMTFTGNENWQASPAWKKTNTSVFFYLQSDMENTVNTTKIYVMSDKFEATSRDGLYNGDTDMIAKTGGFAITIRISDSIATTAQDFKAWLAAQYANGTPVIVWYVLRTPETATVNEPLMKIGNYADTVSNAASIPTTEGANTISVDTEIQPSEFTATWTGWHDASVKEYDGSRWIE